MNENYTLFGTIETPKETSEIKKNMQWYYGKTKGMVCKYCKHLTFNATGNKKFYKCALWKQTKCSATDIRLKDEACGRFEVKT